MEKKVRRFLIDEDESEVYAVSLVDMPAIESDFIYLSKEKQEYIHLESDEKHMIYGPALRPNFPIYRRNGDEEYYIEFSKECIEKLSQKFLKNNYQFSFTADHSYDLHGITVTESWLKADMQRDKSLVLGLDSNLPVGTWFIGCKVENEEVWNKIKEGEFYGFSVEAFCNLNEINFEKHMKEDMNVNESFWEKLKSILLEALDKKETVSEIVEEEVKEEETTVDEVVEEVINEEVEEVVEETINEETIVNEETVEETIEEVVEVLEKEEPKEDLQAIINSLQEKIEELEKHNSDLVKENEKLSKEPSCKKINIEASKEKDAPSWIDFAMGRIQLN